MRILAACSLGGAGHLRPLLEVLRAARRRGDDVLVVGPVGLADAVAEAGFRFAPGAEPPEERIAPIRERLPIASATEAARLANRDLFGTLATEAMLPAMEDVVASWRPDLVLREPCEYASAVVGFRQGVPCAQVAISLAESELGSIRAASPALEAFVPGLANALVASRYLSRFPASLDPTPFPATVRFHEARGSFGTLDPWLEERWARTLRPRVYMSFGTVLAYMSIAPQVYRVALAAMASLDVKVLLTIGRHLDPSLLGPVPPNVVVRPWVDQEVAFAHADLVVCHGGSGTLFGALAAGLPVVVVPLFADQFENARRVVFSGAGSVVPDEERRDESGARTLLTARDSPDLVAAVKGVLAAVSYRDAARRLADEMAATPSADEVLGLLC